MTGLVITLVIFAVGIAIGLVLRARDGSIRLTRPGSARSSAAADLPAPVVRAIDPESRITLVQLSSAACAPCRQAHARLSAVAERSPDLHHAAIDITEQPGVGSALGVLRTPTTVAYDSTGTEVLRVTGVPDTGALVHALRPHLSPAT
ncbi:thioredoxin family protein [Haloechinothrix sp. YIM 98757]|uniref:Thioredoxin family protein n=1 Tax=Haloechinothrix aidingensis TaxID=2752311 RepID=A0A838A7C5_9PSEU|nr:thioredoxin family protein [Haloechinothrix aidingensis]MBA0124407.1 thioredoxin family protein [Haloechinothrix aidingensis]